ncbi:unnamed protein product [Rotaria sp. Silwood1]|nr:unnamed protein product [Rotaria sp. Silwood1]
MVLGPPGTGKSRTIANVVLNILPKLQKKKLLLCAPSNKACDELLRRIVDRFSEENIPCEPGTVIRVGCQASDEYKLSDYYLDHLVLQELVRQLKPKPDLLNSEAQKIEKKIVEKAKIVISTLNYCASTRLRHLVHKLALIIVDEASQGLEPDLLIPLRFRCHKLILVGDPNQLSPTVLSDAGRANYKDKSSTITMLITQYRMHLEICRFPNQCFYGGRLITHSSVAQRMAHFPLRPYSVYDLIHGRHEMDEGTRSSYNMLEVACIQRFCTMLVTNVNIWQSLIGQNSAMESTQSNSTTTIQLNDDFSIAIQRRIAVITPYSAQVALLQKYLPPAIDVMTADSSQGSEKDIIIISCVRGNDSIGFLDDKSRLNVMLTRAKYGLYIFAKVDIRGTGSSEGVLIEREYTIEELNDCEHVIEQLAKYPHSNGRVGMYGLNWSAFNSLMMATFRRPNALQAVFAAHASDDLYKNDIHYPDGILHLDHYIVSIDQTNALPATPDYLINQQWIKQRFTRRPWSDIYLEHQLDNSFWRKHSIKYAYDNLTLPVYLIGGLYDPYKDVPTNIYEHARHISPKIKIVIGPFAHAMPENTNRHPGPGFDSLAEMVRWFNYWLKDNDRNNDILNEPDITLFIRTNLTTRNYRYEPQWPIPRQRIQRMYMNKGQKLTEQVISTTTEDKCVNNNVDTLEYRSWIGFEGGLWLGGLTGDQGLSDENCLIYQTDPIQETIEIVGFVNVSLQLVTTGAINGAQRQMPPANIEPNHPYIITIRLRFTTWTYFIGHRIRVAISNSMFPTYWPSPFAMNTSLFLEPSTTLIDLPVIPAMSSIPSSPLFTQQQVPSDDILSE